MYIPVDLSPSLTESACGVLWLQLILVADLSYPILLSRTPQRPQHPSCYQFNKEYIHKTLWNVLLKREALFGSSIRKTASNACLFHSYHLLSTELPLLLWNSESLGYTIPEGEPGTCKKSKKRTRKSLSARRCGLPRPTLSDSHPLFPDYPNVSKSNEGASLALRHDILCSHVSQTKAIIIDTRVEVHGHRWLRCPLKENKM